MTDTKNLADTDAEKMQQAWSYLNFVLENVFALAKLCFNQNFACLLCATVQVIPNQQACLYEFFLKGIIHYGIR